MKKILIVITTGFEGTGGLTTVMLNYYRNIDCKELSIDFASTNHLDDQNLIKLLSKNNSNYYNLGNRKKGLVKYILNLMNLIRKNRYDVIHVNGNSATMAFELFVAKMLKIPTRIAHGHTTQSGYPFLHNILNPIFKSSYNVAIATSKKAGDWLYKDNYIVLNNAIDLEHYCYSEIDRDAIRKKMCLENAFVVGNVGKLNKGKNHSYLIDVFIEIKKVKSNAVLVIAGGGALYQELQQLCAENNISDSVIFLGMVNDTKEILQAYDVFVFPSIFEGLGMALIEAQATGLKCFASDTVPYESNVTGSVDYLSLTEDPKQWADFILKKHNYDRDEMAKKAYIKISENGYNIKIEVDKLVDIYLKKI